ncbi:MAG: PIN domain-containing protein [Firmicutes bacterium]|nr:PIN domain-containing protein [Bacillota bacterium]
MPAEGDRQFVDTNVLVYAHDISAANKHARAKALVRELWDSGLGCLSIQVLQEFYVVVTRKVPRPLEPERAAGLIADLACWRVHVPQVADVLDAIAIQQEAGISFWDAMVVRSAQALGCRTLWSEDLSHGRIFGSVKVINPFL